MREPGGADAQFAAARDILAAPSSPQQLAEGAALLESASQAGSAAASELRALVEAMGIVGPKNWQSAFDYLQLAAEQGSPSGRSQLLLLAHPGSAPNPDGSHDWNEVRRSISVERLFHVGNRLIVSDAPRIRVIEQFATVHECAWLIERARPRLGRSTVFKKTGEQDVDEGRSNTGTSFQVIDMDVVLEVIRTRIAAATRVPIPLFEPTQVLHYAVGQEFGPHHDFLDPENEAYREQLESGQRIATFLVYLNDGFEGGETEFPAVKIRYRGRTGDAIFWANLDSQGQPDPMTLHSGRPPSAGEKWILSQWIRDRAGPPG